MSHIQEQSITDRVLAIASGHLDSKAPPRSWSLPPTTARSAAYMIPQLMVSPDTLRGMAHDPRAAFVHTQIDGRRTVREIADACGLFDGEVLDIVCELVSRGVLWLV